MVATLLGMLPLRKHHYFLLPSNGARDTNAYHVTVLTRLRHGSEFYKCNSLGQWQTDALNKYMGHICLKKQFLEKVVIDFLPSEFCT